MQNWTKFILVCSGSLIFASIFVLACTLQVDILAPILPNVQSPEELQRRNDYVASSRLEENTETEINNSLSTGHKVVCYLTTPGNLSSTKSRLDPMRVDPHLCTHILVGFASVENCSINLGEDVKLYRDAVQLKAENPGLKVMVSVGGMNEISSGFPEMTQNHANRKIFIRSVLNVTKDMKLDGLDVDWEFPAWLDLDGRQRIHFIQLLYELKKAFVRSGRKLVLSAAVAASRSIVDQCYNVPEIAEHVDFVNLMAYDFRFYSRLLPLTGLNAPLFSDPSDRGPWLSQNVNYSANYWLAKGMPREKIVVGIPTYGHSFALDNADNNGLNAPCNGYGALGSQGFVSYSEVCGFIKNGANVVYRNDSRVPYAFRDSEWLSYDDVVSVTEKANWVRSAGFAGAMIFSLNSDDWNGTCDGKSSFPLTRAIAKEMGI